MEPVVPGKDQESVWDYPRPPKVEACRRHIVVKMGDVVVADTCASMRLLEKAHPPTYYIPPHHVRLELLTLNDHHTHCEYKGMASYYDLSLDGRTVRNVAWLYPDPAPGYEALRGHIAFHPRRVDEALVDGERVTPQEGSFYGGWITGDVVGPFKGGPGTWDW